MVARAIEAVAHPLGRRGFQRGHPGVGRELGIVGEALARAEDPGEGAGGEQTDAADLLHGVNT